MHRPRSNIALAIMLGAFNAVRESVPMFSIRRFSRISGGRRGNKYTPHQGARECHRRRIGGFYGGRDK